MVDDKGIWKIEWEKDIGIKEGGWLEGRVVCQGEVGLLTLEEYIEQSAHSHIHNIFSLTQKPETAFKL